MTPSDQAIDPQLPRGKTGAKRFNIFCSEVGEDDGFHPSFDDGLSSLWMFINRHRHPNKLSVPEQPLIGELIPRGEFL